MRQNTVQAIQTGLDAVGFNGHQPVCLVGGLGTALRGVLDPGYHHWVNPPKGMHFLEQSQLPKTGGACARNRDRQHDTPGLMPQSHMPQPLSQRADDKPQ